MTLRICNREQYSATTGNAPSSFSTDGIPNCACCLTRQNPAADRTAGQPATPKKPDDPQDAEYGTSPTPDRLGACQHIPRLRHDLDAIRCRLDTAGPPQEQGLAEQPLDAPQLRTHRRLRISQHGRRAPDAAGVRDRAQSSQVAEFQFHGFLPDDQVW
jgi:hypothetical protein